VLMLGMPLCYVAAIHRTSVSSVWAVNWSSSLMVMGLAIVLLRERVTLLLWISGIVGFLGVCLLIQPAGVGIMGLLFAAGMALCSSVYKVATRMLRSETSAANLFHTALWVFLPLTLVMPFVFHPPLMRTALIDIAIGIDGFLVLFCLDKAMEWAPAAVTAPLLYLQNVFMAAMAFLFEGFRLDYVALSGIVLIVASSALVVAREFWPERLLLQPGEPDPAKTEALGTK